MTDQARLYGVQKADGTIWQTHKMLSHAEDVAQFGASLNGGECVEVEIVRKGEVEALRAENAMHRKEHGVTEFRLGFLSGEVASLESEREAIVARLEKAMHCNSVGNWQRASSGVQSLLNDLKAGRLIGGKA